jgi:hypothetical protein
MMRIVGGVKETEKGSQNKPTAIRKSISDNNLGYKGSSPCPSATGTGSALGHPLFLRACFQLCLRSFCSNFFRLNRGQLCLEFQEVF